MVALSSSKLNKKASLKARFLECIKLNFIHNKKGVIEMMETFMILFVVFILIGVSMFFFFKFWWGSATETHKEVCLEHGTDLLSSIARMPDISCPGSETSACIDTAKLLAFKAAMDTGGATRRKALESGVCPKTITVEQVYPEPERGKNSTECARNLMTGPDFPENCGVWSVFEPKDMAKLKNRASRKIATPVSLYYPSKDSYGIGKLVITVYTVT